MRFLERERATLAKLLPGLDEGLRAVPLMELEGPDSPGLQLFRDNGGVGLLVPTDLVQTEDDSEQGRAATALDALRVQRALGSRTPSLAVATTMHHFSVAVMTALNARVDDRLRNWFEELLTDRNVVAPGLAMDRPVAGVLSPSLTATETDGAWLTNGVTHAYRLPPEFMDLFLISFMYVENGGPQDGEQVLAVALLPLDWAGVSVSGAGAGAENVQVTLDDVMLVQELVVPAWTLDGKLDDVMTGSFAWFQLLMTGSYLGAASALVERVLLNDQVPESERVRLLVETELAMSAAEGVAGRIDAGDPDESTLAEALYVRYGVQDTLARIIPRAVELLGGNLDSTASEEVAYLATFANGLALHPPTQSQMAGPLSAYLADGPLTLA
ncbi:hypothetical protein [Streptosporangium sp. KLBMP 9127]|nr:hypothetical protein [Streptosporangium sp. KLBMP 9127]